MVKTKIFSFTSKRSGKGSKSQDIPCTPDIRASADMEGTRKNIPFATDLVTTAESNPSSSNKNIPIIDIDKYLLPASKRSPTTGMSNPTEGISGGTDMGSKFVEDHLKCPTVATTEKIVPLIDIGKYLLPASKRRPVPNMERTREQGSIMEIGEFIDGMQAMIQDLQLEDSRNR